MIVLFLCLIIEIIGFFLYYQFQPSQSISTVYKNNIVFDNKRLSKQLFNEEQSYRDSLIIDLQKNTSRWKFIEQLPDSVDKKQKNELWKYVVLNYFQGSTFSIDKGVDLVKFDDKFNDKRLLTNYSIDKEKIAQIIDYKPVLTEINQFLKFGDYLKIEYKIVSKNEKEVIIWVGLSIIIATVFLILLLYYKYSNDNDPIIITKVLDFLEIYNKIEREDLKILAEQWIQLQKKKLEPMISSFQTRLAYLESGDKTFLLLKEELQKDENKVRNLYNNSFLMLGSGIAVAVVGIAIFASSLPTVQDNKLEQYLLASIRPTMMLIFVEGIAFYLLRQFRIWLEDYKYFQKQYQQRINYLSAYTIISESEGNLDKNKLLYVKALLQQTTRLQNLLKIRKLKTPKIPPH